MNITERARTLLTKHLYPRLVELIKDLGLEFVEFKFEGFNTMKIDKNGNLWYKGREGYPEVADSTMDKVIRDARGFKNDTAEQLKMQIVPFSEKIVNLKKIREELLNTLKEMEGNSEIFDDYYKIMLIEKG